MSFATLHKLVAYLLSGLGLLALSLGSELDDSMNALMFVAYAATFFAEGPLLERAFYVRGWTAAVVGLLLLQVARAVSAEPTLAMAIEFAAFLQISRLANRRTAVDYQQIAVLAFLHLIAATVLSTSLVYALIFIGFVIATPWMLAISQLRREIEGNYPLTGGTPEQIEKSQVAMRRVLASKRVVGASFLVSTALLAVPLFAMTLTIFVIVPRVGQGFLSLSRSEGERVAGFGNQIELGGFGVIRDDPTVVLRVRPLPPSEAPVPTVSLRMRGTSFDHYDGRRWTRSPSLAAPLPRFGRDDYPLIRLGDINRDQRLEIVLDHLDESVVFLPHGTVGFSVPPRVVRGEAVSRQLVRSLGLDIRYSDPDELGLVYTAYVSRDAADADLPATAVEMPSVYLQVPPGHERVEALARRLTSGTRSADEAARRIVSYLHSGELRYSLEQPEVKSGERPLDVFLFRDKRGHCEYFASAMAIMLRSIGVPARNVTGFVGGVYNPFGGYYALRQGDAHSWVEAFVENRGWVTYEPTPPSRGELGPRQNLWADVQALVDAMRTRWVTSVVGYDLRTQTQIARRIARFFAQRDFAGGGGSKLDLAERARGSMRTLRNVGLVLLALGAIAGFVVFRARRKRLAAGARALSPEIARAVKLYQELDRVLAARGYGRPASTTPAEHSRKLESSGFPLAREVHDVTEHYMQVRYGGERLSADEHARLRALIAKVRTAPLPEAGESRPR